MDWIKYFDQVGTNQETEPLPPGIIADRVARKIFNFKRSTKDVNLQTLIMYIKMEQKKEFKVDTYPFDISNANNPDLIRPQLEAHGIYQSFLNALESRLKKTPPPAKFDHFPESFKFISDYQEIKIKLIENGYFSESGKWVDFGGGYQTTAAAFIKWVAANGYCMKTKFTDKEIQSFCINDFDFDRISISTIKHAQPGLPSGLSLHPKI